MKNVLFIILFILLVSLVNSKLLRLLQTQSNTNSYDYSNIKSKSTNENLSSKTLESTLQDQSAV